VFSATLLLLWLGSYLCGFAGPVLLDCTVMPCESVLPGATQFEPIEGKPYLEGFDPAGLRLGWVGLSSDLVDISGYSGKPLHTLVGLDKDGVITGGRVTHHSEPILLVGIPESELSNFVEAHIGLRADQKVSIGRSSGTSYPIDGVSGATVTVLSESQTILETARFMAEDVGVIKGAGRIPGHFIDGDPLETWADVSPYLGRLVVSHTQVGSTSSLGVPFVDLWFGLVDSRQLGVPLVGEYRWKKAIADLGGDEHLFVVFNRGTSSFKGSGFVRGGLFDRFRLEQGLRTVTFRDLDYESLASPSVVGTPNFSEGGLFVIRDNLIDPGRPYNLVYLASDYATERGAFERDFYTFQAEQQLSGNFYVQDGRNSTDQIWREAWRIGGWRAVIVVSFYLAVAGVFAARRWSTASFSRLQSLHRNAALGSFLVLGVALHVQPSVTQLLTVAGSVNTGWNWALYLSDPALFVSWIGIAILTLVWGRGAFCGWLCPYGALAELISMASKKAGLPRLELSESWHRWLRNTRYLVFGGLLAAFLYQAELGEILAEIEPFKSTFFVPLWSRGAGAILWWAALMFWSMVTYRPFCRYLCPLGAALAIPSTVRIIGPHRRGFCSKCKICTQGCESRAFREDGSIDPRECLSCWECEANWQSDEVCPPLAAARRRRERRTLKGAA
jgi:NosR/NirI family transcriptional regulator, nitrous oxide reductase regulator